MMNTHDSRDGMPVERPQIFYQIERADAISAACDCACSSTCISTPIENRGEDSRTASRKFVIAANLRRQRLSETHQVVYASNQPMRLAVLNSSAWELLNRFDGTTFVQESLRQYPSSVLDAALTDFLRLGLLVSASHQTKVPLQAPPEQHELLSAWLHITDRCNLRCAYCYLPHAPRDMSLETGKAAIDAVFRSAQRHGFREVKLKYAGGEPLLRFPLILELQQYAQERAKLLEIFLQSIILSNGTLLTPKMLEAIHAHQIRLMISLDDLGQLDTNNAVVSLDAHSGKIPKSRNFSQRCYADGRSASSEAMRGIESALQTGLSPEISITVSSANLSQLPALVHWALARNLPFGLNFYREHERCNGQRNLKVETHTFIRGMLAAYKVIEANLPQRSLLAALLDRVNLAVPHSRPCSVGQSYLVIDCQGNIAKCQMRLAQPITSVAASDPLGQIHADRSGIQNISVDDKDECAACEWKYWCAGGCPLSVYRETGAYQAHSPYCDVYRALLPEVIRLEGLRLLSRNMSDRM